MRIFVVLLFSCFWVLTASAQKTKQAEPSYFVFDKNGDPTKMENAKFLGVLEKVSDTAYVWQYYHFDGPLMNVATFKDSGLTTPHGYIAYFDEQGRIDSSGYTFDGRHNRLWLIYSDSLTVIRELDYDHGTLVASREGADIRMKTTPASAKNDTIQAVIPEVAASFKGSDKAWKSYLKKNMKYPERASALKKSGTVLVMWIVTKDGTLNDIHLNRSVEYSIDQEAMRLLRESPKWNPATKGGRALNAFRRQPFTFAL